MLKRLKYVSRFTQPMSHEAIEDIVTRAQANNHRLGVTGMMMASGGVFFQVLEGPAAVVDALYAKISSDPRHVDVVCLRIEDDREERMFADWSMKLLDLDRDARVRATPLRQKLFDLSVMQAQMAAVAGEIEREAWDTMQGALRESAS